MLEQSEKKLAVLIDADNISASLAGDIFKKAYAIGTPIARRAYGMVNCFTADGGWAKAQREYGVVARPQVSNVSGKNVADIALVIDAMEFLYKSPCDGICVVSCDSDFSALAAKIREGGKAAYGMGGSKTPASFRNACTKFFELRQIGKNASAKTDKPVAPRCPRCGGVLKEAWTKSKSRCYTCAACGGMSSRIDALKKTVSQESMAALIEAAKRHEQPGCSCPSCGASMSILKVSVGKRHVEIDVCGACRTIWYDKGEFETLVPQDGPLSATVTAGKAYRRETVLAVAADLRSGHLKVLNKKSLDSVLRVSYHVPVPDVSPIISALQSQRVIQIDSKSGAVKVVKA